MSGCRAVLRPGEMGRGATAARRLRRPASAAASASPGSCGARRLRQTARMREGAGQWERRAGRLAAAEGRVDQRGGSYIFGVLSAAEGRVDEAPRDPGLEAHADVGVEHRHHLPCAAASK